MSGYLEGMALGFGFNVSEGLDSAQQSTASPSSNTQQDASFHTQPNSFQGNVTVYQTTGPDAHTSPIHLPGSNTPALNPRSCVTCRRRKVRCDKQMPCSNCRRAQIPCVFPAPGRAPRQPRRKDPNAPTKNSSQREIELMKRLRKLEGIVEELSGQIEVESGGKGPSSTNSPEAHAGQTTSFDASAHNAQRQSSNAGSHAGNIGRIDDSPRGGSDATSEQSETARKNMHKKFGRLVLSDTGGSQRYVSHGFWSKLNDELDSIREETQKLTDEDLDESDEDETLDTSPASALSGNHNAWIFGYRSADVDLDKYWPLPSHIPFLWSVYQENVEPLLKVLHIPTMEPIFRDARKDHKQLSPANEALVWSIYYAALTSLEPDEVRANLGLNKEDVVVQYRFAVEQALAKANFLNSLETPIMQALIIFILVVKGQDGSRFCWSLTGLVAHLAQGMGLHRDGSHFDLSPFETEMRRRLWWSLLLLDLRSADELGTDLIIQDFNYDTQMPSNINDTDIKPDSTEAPEPREGHSDCSLALVRFEIAGFGRRLVRLSSASMSFCPQGMPYKDTSLAERERMLIEVYNRVEQKFLKHHTGDSDPLHWMAASIARIIMAKMTLVIYQPVLFPGSEGEGTLSEEAKERAYVAAIEIAEYNHILNNDSRSKQFRWLFKTYTNWSAMAYFLIASCRRPWTPLVERGWEAVNGYEGRPGQLVRSAEYATVVMPIRKLYMRAQRHRAAEIARLRGNPEEARRLEFEERTNPRYQARFGQDADGAANKMEEIREKWKVLVRSDGSNVPISTPAELSPVMAPSMLQPKQEQVPSRPRTPSAYDVPATLDLSDTTMGYMNDLMADTTPFPMVNFWPLQDVGSVQIKAMGTGMTPMSNTSQLPQYTIKPGDTGQQFSPQTMQFPKDDNPPPYLWGGQFPSVNSTSDNTGLDDVDMLGDDFNWHTWSQNVRGL
ncbi:hypothetical protein QWA68_009165 [Fusarium oxysporum]|nr:hypothetical protein QWA68_009165 [Fusarium oxysporum]